MKRRAFLLLQRGLRSRRDDHRFESHQEATGQKKHDRATHLYAEETLMSYCRDRPILAQVALIAAGFFIPGCTSAGHRNLSAAVIVTASPSLADGDVTIVLELRNAREEFSLSESDAFLASNRAAKLSHAVRSQLRERCQTLRRTMPQARSELSDGLAIIRPDPQRACANGNIVVYAAGKSEIHVLFSCAEIGHLLAFKELADDLATIRYTHPAFDSTRLRALRDRIATLGLKVENVSLSRPELERLKTEAAARVLERYLRESGLPLPDGSPLMVSGPLSSTRSPKLTAALKDPSVIERLLRNHDPDVLRALVFLVNRRVIGLEYP